MTDKILELMATRLIKTQINHKEFMYEPLYMDGCRIRSAKNIASTLKQSKMDMVYIMFALHKNVCSII